MTNQGETNLSVLLASMQPVLNETVYGFATVSADYDSSSLTPLLTFHEPEGVTLIVELEKAEAANLTTEFACRMISLNIHSSLDAVGFLARITTHLAKLGMGVNPVSGFYHDHLFVPADRAEEALEALRELSESCFLDIEGG